MSELDHARLIAAMTAYYAGDPRRIQHFMKVYAFARTIGALENMDPVARFTLETAAIVHDIGIKISEEKYGSYAGPYQELEGPPLAEDMLCRLGFSQKVRERVCWLVGHHHTYSPIDGPDHQILVEADFLVNLFEDHSDTDAILSAYRRIFKTESGKQLCRDMFGLKGEE